MPANKPLQLTKWQSEVQAVPARFKVLCIGRGAGKTEYALETLLFKACSKNNTRVLYISPTFISSRDIAWARLKNRLEGLPFEANEARLEIILPNKSQIILRSWDALETIRGQEFSFIVIDEVAMMRNFLDGFEAVLRPTLRMSMGDVLFISTPRGKNHYFDLYNRQITDKDWRSFTYTTYDNPHINRDEIESMKSSMSEIRFQQEILALFVKHEGLVFQEFDKTVHVKEMALIPKERLMGIDFGFTNPFSVLEIYVTSENQYYVKSEWYKTGKTTQEAIEYMKTKEMPNKVYADPAEPDRIEEMKRAGFPMRDVTKNVTAQVDRVRELFKTNKLFIDPSCTDLIWELETLSYVEAKDGKALPEKQFEGPDHSVDALKYCLFNHGMYGQQREAITFTPERKYATVFTPNRLY